MTRRYSRRLPYRLAAAVLMIVGLVGSVAVPANAAPGRFKINATVAPMGQSTTSTNTPDGIRSDLFVAGTDGNLYQSFVLGTGTPGNAAFAGPPSGIGLGPSATWVTDGSRLDVFVTGMINISTRNSGTPLMAGQTGSTSAGPAFQPRRPRGHKMAAGLTSSSRVATSGSIRSSGPPELAGPTG